MRDEGRGTRARAEKQIPRRYACAPLLGMTWRAPRPPSRVSLFVRPLRPRANHRVHGVNALLGESIGGEIGRDAFFVRDGEDAEHRVVNLVGLAEGARRGP